jgi:tripeptide aminopeptidase
MPIPVTGAAPDMAAAPWHTLAEARRRLALRDDDLVRVQVELAQVPAPTGDEGARGERVLHAFQRLRLDDVHTDDAGNVIGCRRGSTDLPPVVVCAHLDTVFPAGTDLTVRRTGSQLVGPGITDNARGLAAMLAIAEVLDGHLVRTTRTVEFVATTGEEGTGDLRGARHYFATRGAGAHAAIAVDGTGDERIIHRALGSRRFRIALRGPGGHSWSAFGTANPVHVAAAITAALTACPLPADPRCTMTVSRIGGGHSINSVPEDAWIEVDIRSTDGASLGTLCDMLHAEVARAVATENARRLRGTAAMTASVQPLGDRPCGMTGADHPLVQLAIGATALIGRTPELALASTDASVPIALGIPAIAIGAGGRGGDAHSVTEWFENIDGPLGVARALTIIAGTAGIAAD